MSITFIKYNGPKIPRNGNSLGDVYYKNSAVYTSSGGSSGSSNVDLSNYVTLSNQEWIRGVKNFEGGITFGMPIYDASGNFYFGTIGDQAGYGGSISYDVSLNALISTLPIISPGGDVSVFKYSEIDSSLGLEDTSAYKYFNAYTTQKIHERVYALETAAHYFEFDASLNAVKCLYPLYTDGWLSAGGINDSSSGGGSGSITVHPWDDITDNFNDSDVTSTFNAYTIKRIYQMAQSAGSYQSITYDDVIDALGYTPADASAIGDDLTAADISTALGYIPANDASVLDNLTAADISTALGYIPANSADVSINLTASDISTALGYIPADAASVLSGLSDTDVINALGYTPYNSTNPNGYLNANDFKTINNQSVVGSGNIEITFDTTNIDDAINDVSTRVASNTEKINDVSIRVANNTEKINDVSTRLANTIGNLDNTIADISTRIASNTTKINDVSARVYSLENNPLWEHFHYDASLNAVYTDTNFYSMGWSSAGGINDASSGSGSGNITVHPWDDITDNFNDSDITSTFNAYTIKKIYQMAQTAGSLQSITYDDVIDALGYTPADASAIGDDLTAFDISTALGYTPANDASVLENLTAADISTALGYIPANAADIGTDLTAADISTALGYIPYNSITNNAGYITSSDISTFTTKTYVDGCINTLRTYVDSSISSLKSYVDGSISSLSGSMSSMSTDISILLGRTTVYVDQLSSAEKISLATKLWTCTNTKDDNIPIMYIYDKVVYHWKKAAAQNTVYLFAIDNTINTGTGNTTVSTTGHWYKLDAYGSLSQMNTFDLGSGGGNYDASIAALNASVSALDTSVSSLTTRVNEHNTRLNGLDTSVNHIDASITLMDTSISNLDSSVTAISNWITTAGSPVIDISALSSSDASALYNEMVDAAVNNYSYDKVLFIGDDFVYKWFYVPQSESNWKPSESYPYNKAAYIQFQTFTEDASLYIHRKSYKWIGTTELYYGGTSAGLAYLNDFKTINNQSIVGNGNITISSGAGMITATDISTALQYIPYDGSTNAEGFLKTNDVSLFITANDVSTHVTSNDKSIRNMVYLDASAYENLSVKDPYTIYFIKEQII